MQELFNAYRIHKKDNLISFGGVKCGIYEKQLIIIMLLAVFPLFLDLGCLGVLLFGSVEEQLKIESDEANLRLLNQATHKSREVKKENDFFTDLIQYSEALMMLLVSDYLTERPVPQQKIKQFV